MIEDPRAPELKFARIDLEQISSDAIESVARAIAQAMPRLGRGAIVLVDSPGNPRGWDPRPGRAVLPPPRGRAIDAALRQIVAEINRTRDGTPAIALRMFPTPAIGYFIRCAADPRCKPHLAAFAREALGIEPRTQGASSVRRGGGWLFTRFMLSGFVVFRALERMGACAFEAYPYLAFALHKAGHERLPPKSARRDALAERITMINRLACDAALRELPVIASLDQADAAVLALAAAIGAADGGLCSIRAPGEGCFLFAVSRRDRAAVAALIAIRRPSDSA
jgi:hypothetical protein